MRHARMIVAITDDFETGLVGFEAPGIISLKFTEDAEESPQQYKLLCAVTDRGVVHQSDINDTMAVTAQVSIFV